MEIITYTVSNIDKCLETYSLEEILELNDITQEEALDFLITQDFLKLPVIKPVDLDD